MIHLDKDIAYLIKVKIRDSVTVCRFNQVCRTANLHKVHTLPNGSYHGFWKDYYSDTPSNGQLYSKGTYRDGLSHGPWKFYYSSGQLWYKGSYKDGKQHGLWNYYDRNEQIYNE